MSYPCTDSAPIEINHFSATSMGPERDFAQHMPFAATAERAKDTKMWNFAPQPHLYQPQRRRTTPFALSLQQQQQQHRRMKPSAQPTPPSQLLLRRRSALPFRKCCKIAERRQRRHRNSTDEGGRFSAAATAVLATLGSYRRRLRDPRPLRFLSPVEATAQSPSYFGHEKILELSALFNHSPGQQARWRGSRMSRRRSGTGPCRARAGIRFR